MLETKPVQCPYCGETFELLLDPSVPEQDYIEDCEVCCRPINLTVRVDREGTPSVEVRREDE